MPQKPNKHRLLAQLLLFFGGFFMLLAAQEGCYQESVKLRGVVIAKEYSPGTSRIGPGGTSSSSSHSIRYRFTMPDGTTREDRGKVLLQHWSKMREGDTVAIEYLPATKDSRVARQTASATVFLLIAVALLSGGFLLNRQARTP